MERTLNIGIGFVTARWRLLAAMGVASIVLGMLAIAASFAATLATVFILGCLIIGGGIVHFVESLHTRGWGGFFGHALAAVLYGVAGWYMIVHPAAGAASLTLLIGMLLAAGGLYQIIASLAMRYRSWGWGLVQGAVGLTLGILIFAQWPASALWVIGIFVGIDLVLRGWATLMLALGARAGEALEQTRMTTSGLERRHGVGDRRAVAA